MNALSVSSFETDLAGHRIDISIRMGEKNYLVYYQTEDALLSLNPEAILAVLLLPALKKKYDHIGIPGSISERFLSGIDAIQKTFQSWKPNYGIINTAMFSTHANNKKFSGKTGVYFSAGIDSYYSLLTHLNEVDALVHIEGFDIEDGKKIVQSYQTENIRQIGRIFNKQTIVIQTNVKQFLENSLAWTLSHGSAMASIGHLLAPGFGKFYLASGGNPITPPPFGVHPLIDPNWSSDIVEFIHDALAVNKIEKLRFIGQFEPVLSTLRVCLRNSGKKLNCGMCEKCLRTMVYAQVTGIYEQLRVFERSLDLRILGNYKHIGSPERDLLYIAQASLAEQGTYPATEQVLRKILFRKSWKKKFFLRAHKVRSNVKKNFLHSR